MRTLSLIVLGLMAAGCDDTVDCPSLAAVSVTVTVIDETDEPVTDATVEFVTGEAAPGACESVVAGIYNCGYEVEGEITVSATADGLGRQEATVTVVAGECNVVGERVTLTLPFLD